jgi:hypothetical protein
MQSTNTKPLAGPKLAPPLPLGKRPPSAAIITGKEKKESQFRIWMVEQIIICQILTYDICFWSLYIYRGPFSHYICNLLSPHLWYRYLKIKKCWTFCFARLLVPTELCILITPSKLAMCNNIIGDDFKNQFCCFPPQRARTWICPTPGRL